MSAPHLDLRHFLSSLRKENEVVDIDYEVDPHLELAEIHRRIAAANGPVLFFRRVKGSKFPVVTNLFGSPKRIDLAFGKRPEKFIETCVKLLHQPFPPRLSELWKKRDILKMGLKLGTKKVQSAPVLKREISPPNLEKLPFLKTWPLDGGPFLTLPLVYTEPPGGGPPNLGMYRIQRYGPDTTGLHFQIAKGGGFHYSQAEALNQPLPVNIFLGGPPALILSAIAPLPENVPELMLCSLLQEKKLGVSHIDSHPYPLIANCEFALVGEAKPHQRAMEGPFGDHYGYYSWAHEFPVFDCKKIYHRKDAIYPATVVGKPIQEDFYIGIYLQKLLSPLFSVVMPGVKSLWSYGEAGFHSIAAAVVKERYYRECMGTGFRILGEGQLALTKFLLLTNEPVNLEDFPKTLQTVLERFTPETDLFVFSPLSLDTLDYTGPALNKGSRGIMMGIGEKKRSLPYEFKGSLPSPLTAAAAFCPGCLVLEGPAFTSYKDFMPLLSHPDFADWPLLILVDNLSKALKNTASFLWTTFTRFEPAADLHIQINGVHRHRPIYKGPLLIDARMKPSYPPEVLCDPETAKKVTENWRHYFPQGMAMGDSDTAHIV